MSDSLNELFAYCPPDKLKKSILEVFFVWVIEQPVLPNNYKEVTEDFYLLLKHIEEQEKKYKEAGN